MFAVFVTLEIRPDRLQEFLDRVRRQAADSLEKEAGCKLFEVWTDTANPNRVQLYEIYSDAAAFHDVHLKTAHFERFDADVGPMVEDKTVLTFDNRL